VVWDWKGREVAYHYATLLKGNDSLVWGPLLLSPIGLINLIIQLCYWVKGVRMGILTGLL
jgi:hypothetical protein